VFVHAVHAFSLQVETALLDSLAGNEVHEEQESRSQTELRTSQRSQFPVERRQGIQKGMLFPRFFGQEFRRIQGTSAVNRSWSVQIR